MRQFLQDHADDVLLLAGCGCILHGLGMWSAMAAWIAAGVMLVVFGVLMGVGKGRQG